MNIPESFELIPCPVCKKSEFKNILTLRAEEFLGNDREYTNLKPLKCNQQTPFHYTQCTSCNFVGVNPRIKNEYHHYIYNEVKVDSYNKFEIFKTDTDLKMLYETHSKVTHLRAILIALNLLHSHFAKVFNYNKKQIKILDYGCGRGHILDLAKTFGCDAYGVDVDKFRLAECTQKGHNVSLPADLKITGFDAILSTSVIEHVTDLHEYFSFISSHLKPNGVFVFNGLSPAIIPHEIKKKKFKNVHPIEHLNFFDFKSLKKLAAQYNLKPIRYSMLWKGFRNDPSMLYYYLTYTFKRLLNYPIPDFTEILIKED